MSKIRYDTGTASLAASVNDYIFENGRRYHVYYGKDKNLLPDDEVCSTHTLLFFFFFFFFFFSWVVFSFLGAFSGF